MSGSSASLYFVVSGEHPTLPLAELASILHVLEVKHKLTKVEYKLVGVEANASVAPIVAGRAGYTEEAGVEILHAESSLADIFRVAKATSIADYVSPADRFSLRVVRFAGVSRHISRVKLESDLGGLIAEQTGARVDLTAPRKLLRGILSDQSFRLGLVAYQRPKGAVANRRPRKRPAFHPSTMVPKLARCMVNLAQPKEGAIFLDPFCGVGGILLEASLIGCRPIGIDAIPRMLRGTRKNLYYFGTRPLGLITGDARHLPLRRVDAIATDPPYGTGASTLKSTTKEILTDFLPQARSLLQLGGRTVLASPVGTRAADVAENSGFTVMDRHEVYVHRSLTREILVLGAA